MTPSNNNTTTMTSAMTPQVKPLSLSPVPSEAESLPMSHQPGHAAEPRQAAQLTHVWSGKTSQKLPRPQSASALHRGVGIVVDVGLAGDGVGNNVGDSVGGAVGSLVGAPVGGAVGDSVGSAVGESVGAEVGASVGGCGRRSSRLPLLPQPRKLSPEQGCWRRRPDG